MLGIDTHVDTNFGVDLKVYIICLLGVKKHMAINI